MQICSVANEKTSQHSRYLTRCKFRTTWHCNVGVVYTSGARAVNGLDRETV